MSDFVDLPFGRVLSNLREGTDAWMAGKWQYAGYCSIERGRKGDIRKVLVDCIRLVSGVREGRPGGGDLTSFRRQWHDHEAASHERG